MSNAFLTMRYLIYKSENSLLVKAERAGDNNE